MPYCKSLNCHIAMKTHQISMKFGAQHLELDGSHVTKLFDFFQTSRW